MLTPSMGINGSTSVAPTRGCAPLCFVRSISSTALPVPRSAASATASGSPASVTTERLWSASISRSSTYTPGTLLIAATMASTFAASRPSEKFATHSISRFIVLASCPVVPANCSAVSALNPNKPAFVYERWLIRIAWCPRSLSGRSWRLRGLHWPCCWLDGPFCRLRRTWQGFQWPLRSDHRLHVRRQRLLHHLRRRLDRSPRLFRRAGTCSLFPVAPHLPGEPRESSRPQSGNDCIVAAQARCLSQNRNGQRDHHHKPVEIFFEQALCRPRRDLEEAHPPDRPLRIVRLRFVRRHGLRDHASRSSSNGRHQNNKEFPGSRPLRIRQCPPVCQPPVIRCFFPAAAHKLRSSSPP